MSPHRSGASDAVLDADSLRWRLIAILALTLSPILLFGVLNAIGSARQRQEERQRELVVLAESILDAVQDAVDGAPTLLAALAPFADSSQCAEVYRRALAINAAYTNIATVGLDGLVGCSARETDGEVRAEPEQVVDAIRAGAPFALSPVIWGEISNQPLIAAYRRLEGPDGAYRGAIGLGISVSGLAELTRSQGGGGVRTALIGTDGFPAADEDSPLSRFEPAMLARLAAEPAISLRHRLVDGTAIDAVVSRFVDDALYFVVWDEADPLLTWQAVDPIADVALPLLVWLAALLVTWFAVERLILDWLDYLRRIALVYASGRYKVKPQRARRAPSEIADLADAMEAMADRISSRDASLREAVAQRDAAMKEIHHRVKNNLQIITSFLNLQSRQVSDPAGLAALADARARINALSLVHRSLYETENLETVRLGPFFTDLFDHLTDALGLEDRDIALEHEILDVELEADRAIALALFAVEAITNAGKHAFPDDREGTVTVRLADAGQDRLALSICDDGVGLPETQAEPARMRLGATLIDGFAKQARGVLTRSASAAGGLCLDIVFPAMTRTGSEP